MRIIKCNLNTSFKHCLRENLNWTRKEKLQYFLSTPPGASPSLETTAQRGSTLPLRNVPGGKDGCTAGREAELTIGDLGQGHPQSFSPPPAGTLGIPAAQAQSEDERQSLGRVSGAQGWIPVLGIE